MHAVQVTSHQLQLQQEADRKAQEAAAEEASKAKKRVVTEDLYSQLVDSHNVNRDAGDDGARSVTEALSALGVQESEDKHPERYFAAAPAVCQHCLKFMSESGFCSQLYTLAHIEMSWWIANACTSINCIVYQMQLSPDAACLVLTQRVMMQANEGCICCVQGETVAAGQRRETRAQTVSVSGYDIQVLAEESRKSTDQGSACWSKIVTQDCQMLPVLP